MMHPNFAIKKLPPTSQQMTRSKKKILTDLSDPISTRLIPSVLGDTQATKSQEHIRTYIKKKESK